MRRTSPFIDTAAVEAWDSWFRWRERGRLRDLDVEATWRRVAVALSSRPASPVPVAELLEACASWRLLLDERILAGAGTAEACWPDDALVALINVPIFVRNRFTAQATIDLASLAQTARLAVTALDAAADLGMPAGAPARTLRIGLTGLADALALLGLGYASDAARRQAAGVAGVLAQACLEAGIRLARDRGCDPSGAEAQLERARRRGFPADLLRDLVRHGARYAALTAITSQPRLALLANNVSDALDPLPGERQRPAMSAGYAHSLRRALALPSGAAFAPLAERAVDAQLAMRGAVQPWIDAAIVYPLAMRPTPGAAAWDALADAVARPGDPL